MERETEIEKLRKTITEKDAILKDYCEHMEAQNRIIEDLNEQLQKKGDENSIAAKSLRESEECVQSLQKDLDEVRTQLVNSLRSVRTLEKQNKDMSKQIQRLEERSNNTPYPLSCTSTLSSGNLPIPCSSLGHEPTQDMMEGSVSSGYQTSLHDSLVSENGAPSKSTPLAAADLMDALNQLSGEEASLEAHVLKTSQTQGEVLDNYASMQGQERTITSLKRENEKLKRENKAITKTCNDLEDNFSSLLKDLEKKASDLKEKQVKLKQMEDELLSVKQKLEDSESENQQLCVFLKEHEEEKRRFEEERKKLTEELSTQRSMMASHIQTLEHSFACEDEEAQPLTSLTSAMSSMNIPAPIPCSSMGNRSSGGVAPQSLWAESHGYHQPMSMYNLLAAQMKGEANGWSRTEDPASNGGPYFTHN